MLEKYRVRLLRVQDTRWQYAMSRHPSIRRISVYGKLRLGAHMITQGGSAELSAALYNQVKVALSAAEALGLVEVTRIEVPWEAPEPNSVATPVVESTVKVNVFVDPPQPADVIDLVPVDSPVDSLDEVIEEIPKEAAKEEPAEEAPVKKSGRRKKKKG